MKTYIPSVEEAKKNQKWYLVDLKGQTLGRAAVKVAEVLRGKNKPTFTPHMDIGDYVVAINASEMVISGDKGEQKIYYRYSGYPGGLKSLSFKEMMEKFPERAFEQAVKGMLPKNRLGRKLFKKLHVYRNENHRHSAQKPEELKIS